MILNIKKINNHKIADNNLYILCDFCNKYLFFVIYYCKSNDEYIYFHICKYCHNYLNINLNIESNNIYFNYDNIKYNFIYIIYDKWF